MGRSPEIDGTCSHPVGYLIDCDHTDTSALDTVIDTGGTGYQSPGGSSQRWHRYTSPLFARWGLVGSPIPPEAAPTADGVTEARWQPISAPM